MIVVSDTSPLTNLAAIGQFGLLQKLYSEIHIPDAVWAELNAFGQRWPGASEVEQAAWIHRHPVKNRALVVSLQRDLDLGEAEGIALAIELNADLILLDEREGRHAAHRLGLRTVGVIGVLLEAKTRHNIPLVQPHLEALRHTAGFFINDDLYEQAPRLAQE